MAMRCSRIVDADSPSMARYVQYARSSLRLVGMIDVLMQCCTQNCVNVCHAWSYDLRVVVARE